MTDRAIVYNTAIPQTTDLLKASKFAMLGDAFLAMSVLGNSAESPSTVVSGLACTPTSPASLLVNLGPGAIFSLDATDSSAYGDLGTDPIQIYKMGIRPTTGTLTITPPATVGYSQVFLVQAILSNIDGGSEVLSYYNSSNPSIPYSGPSNSGTSQFTTRTSVCTIALKAGVAATTGTQVTPSPDAGYIALYAITVANGQTQINTSHIVAVNGGYAPFVNTALPYIPSAAQSGKWIYAVDTGSVNALIASTTPALTSYTAGLTLRIKASSNNTAASTLNVNGLGAKSIIRMDGSALESDEIIAGAVQDYVYDGAKFQLRGAVGRAPLVSDTTVYVNNATGSDTLYDGRTALVSGVHGPFKTLFKALAVMSAHNLNGYDFYIRIADGTYPSTATIQLPTPNGSGNVNIIGNQANPSAVVIYNNTSGSVLAAGGGRYFLKGLYIEGTSAGHGIWSSGSAVVWCADIHFGPCPGGAHFSCDAGGFLGMDGHARIYGSAQFHIYSVANGTFVVSGTPTPAVAVMNSVAFSGAFTVSIGSYVDVNYGSVTYGGGVTVTGQRYSATLGGVINAGGHGATWLPGSIAGATSTGGQYA